MGRRAPPHTPKRALGSLEPWGCAAHAPQGQPKGSPRTLERVPYYFNQQARELRGLDGHAALIAVAGAAARPAVLRTAAAEHRHTAGVLGPAAPHANYHWEGGPRLAEAEIAGLPCRDKDRVCKQRRRTTCAAALFTRRYMHITHVHVRPTVEYTRGARGAISRAPGRERSSERAREGGREE